MPEIKPTSVSPPTACVADVLHGTGRVLGARDTASTTGFRCSGSGMAWWLGDGEREASMTRQMPYERCPHLLR